MYEKELPSGQMRNKAQTHCRAGAGEAHTLAQMSLGTSEPFRVVLDGAQSRAVPEATVDHRINGQEVRDRGCKQIPL